ncbi:MAG: septum formation initiator family protein [Verrucomicrobiales bacterium]|jgi:cell division protein FtsB|nr:septum formation initiator family protein [Verrucomicrobiales bacterium]
MGAHSKFFDPRSVKTAARRATGEPWQKITPWLYLLATLLLAVLAGVIYRPVILKNQELLNRKADLQVKIGRENEKKRQLEEELAALMNDPYYIERMARDILKYGRPGEIIFKFPDDLSNSENPPAKPSR